MSASAYLLRILARPETEQPVETWTSWYKVEAVPKFLDDVKATRASLYHAYNTFVLQTKTPLDGGETELHDAKLAQTTDFESPTDKVVLLQVQLESADHPEDIFRLATPPTAGEHAAVADVRIYKLLQDYDPDRLGHVRAPFILNVQCEPADAADYTEFYEGEHLDMLSRVPAYRRSQRYEFVAGNWEGAKSAVPRFMAVHEWDNLDNLDGPELREADASVNTRRVFGNALKVNIRGFKNLAVFGDLQE